VYVAFMLMHSNILYHGSRSFKCHLYVDYVPVDNFAEFSMGLILNFPRSKLNFW
jgi:hypothetical protein